MTTRAYRLAASVICAATLAACGGNSGAIPTTSTPASLPAIQQTGSTAMSVVAVGANSALTVAGTIVRLIPGGVQIQGGKGLGYFDIYTNAGTVVNGKKPYAGEAISATGTGSANSTMTATSITQLFAVTGPIVGMKKGGFQMQGGRGIGYINIWTNANTHVAGRAPFVGENVSVLGSGSLSTTLTAVTFTENGTGTTIATPAPTAAPTANATATPVPAPTSGPQSTSTQPQPSAFMPSSWGKISAMQVFDDTSNGAISQAAAAANGYRYVAVWGARNNIGTSWLNSNPSLQTAYYGALETDASPTAWGAIGHTLTWWKANHPDWVLYACTAAGSVSANPAYVPGLDNMPLDVHNPAVVDYQVRLMANYAHKLGYKALAVDEATFWQSDAGAGSGSYGCGIYQNGAWVQRYTGVNDPNWAADVVAWVKRAHTLLTTDPVLAAYNLKLIVNHPAGQINANEQTFLANVDADLNEDGYTFYGNYVRSSAAYFTRTANWTEYAQQHGVAVLTNDNWGPVTVGTPQLDWSVATYLIANEQAEALFSANSKGYGLENWHNQYKTAVGAPCGQYYSANDAANPSIYYRRFANAIVVVNGGSGAASEVAHLPAGHTYTDLFGRPVSNPLTIGSNDGYVLLTANGCN